MSVQRGSALAALGMMALLGLTGCGAVGGGGPKLDRPYLEVRRGHATVLTEKRRAPEQASDQQPPANVKVVTYPSGDLKLAAWFVLPAKAPADDIPAIVFFHGGFALGADDLKECKPFLDAGYAVLLPSLRGENKNEGNFELMYGEVDDGRAAVQWLAAQPRIDKGRIYTFGHSVGGGISALLSLWDDVPVLATGSSGGLFPYTVFAAWSEILPFDRRNPLERQLRLLLGNTADMKHKHHAYIGSEDDLKSVVGPAEAEIEQTGAPLRVTLVDGDHVTCLRHAIRAFLRDIQRRK
jgi:acetyl esterase/lipase